LDNIKFLCVIKKYIYGMREEKVREYEDEYRRLSNLEMLKVK